MKKKTRILILEDRPSDVGLVEAELKKAKIEFESKVVATEEDFRRGLEDYFPDLILSDYALPQFDGMKALNITMETLQTTPFIIVTGSLDEETAVECMKAGAADYVLKQHLGRLGPAVKNALDRKRVQEEKEAAKIALRYSEERFRNLVENISEIFYVCDVEGKLTYGSPNLFTATGYQPSEILGHSYTRLVHEADRHRVVEFYDTQTKSSTIDTKCEFRARVKNGNPVWVEQATRIIRDDTGRVLEYRNLVRDITERKRAEEALRESEAKFSAAIQSSPVALVITTPDGKIVETNHAFCDLVGYSRQEIIGKTVNDLGIISPQVSEKLVGAIESVGGSVRNREVKFRVRDGGMRDILYSVETIFFHGIPHRISTGVDITERKLAEGALKLFRTLVDRTNDAIEVIDPQTGRFLDVNERACLDLGYSREELLALTVFDIDPTVDRSSYVRAQEELRKTGSMLVEGQHRRKDGSTFPVEVNIKLVQLVREYIVTVVRDITERKRVEREISMLASALKSIKECVSITDLEDTILFVNRSFVETYGYSESELIGQNIDIVRSPNNPRDLVRDILPATLKGGWIGEALNRRKDGSEFSIFLSTTSILGENGQAIALIGVASDITERKRAEQRLRDERNLLNTLINSIPDEIAFKDTERRFVLVNPAAVRALSKESADDVLGKKDEDLIPEEFANAARLLEDQVIATGKPALDIEGKPRLDPVTGEINRAILISKSPIRDKNGTITGLVLVNRDITERKKAEELHKQLQQQLNQAQKMESIGTLAGGIAHDFNNILGIIVAYGSLLQRGNVSTKDLREYTDTMMKAAERGTGLVKQILTFARKSDVSVESVQINHVIKELISMLHQMFPKTIGFSVDLDKSLPIISIDSGQLNQALMNLCVNARDAILEANKAGKMQSTISIRTAKVTGEILRKRFSTTLSEHYISVSVSDTGVGMDEKTKQKMFEPFFTTKEQGKGTGLGLAVVYGIVHSHQGIIDLESEIGKGTTFTLYFPVPKDVSGSAAFEKKELEEISGGSETILVIEDEEALRMLLKSLLQAKGYTVMTASDGLEGVEIFEKNKDKIAAVISDHGLPGMNGADAVKKMIAAKRSLKCILASGYIEPQQKSEIFKSGVKEFIQKPYDPMEVVRKVREVLDSNG